MDIIKKISGSRNLAPFVTLAALFAICCVASGDFRSAYNLLNISRQVACNGLLALGMTLVIAGGGIDLSVGSLLALSGVLGLQAMNALPSSVPQPLAFALMVSVSLATGLLGGVVNGMLTAFGRVPPFIATLGTFSIFRSLAVYRADAGLVQSSNFYLNAVATVMWRALPFVVLLFTALLLFGMLRLTRFGWRICAVGANEKASIYAGVNVRSVRLVSYLITGFLCGVASILIASRFQSISSTGAGNAYELDAIAAVIIGGTPMTGGRASMFGTLAGVFILGIIGNVLDLWSISANLQGVVKGLIIIMAVLSQYKRNKVAS